MLIKTTPYGDGDAYVDLATADAFHELRKTAAWAAASDDDLRTAAIVLASDYIAANYQFAETDTLPHVISLAAMALAPAMLAAPTITPTDNRAVIEKTLIGPAGVQTTTKWVAITGSTDPYPDITAILAPALAPRSPVTVLKLVR